MTSQSWLQMPSRIVSQRFAAYSPAFLLKLFAVLAAVTTVAITAARAELSSERPRR